MMIRAHPGSQVEWEGQWPPNVHFELNNGQVGLRGSSLAPRCSVRGPGRFEVKGGAIIVVVVSWLVNYIVMPMGLNFFFVFFVGTVQAFVFTMLTLTYISVEVNE